MNEVTAELSERLGRLSDLGSFAALASWDQQTKMPEAGAASRASASATLAELAHREFTSAETGRLIERADGELQARDADPDSDEVRLVAVARRRYEKAVRVPESLAADLARSASTAQAAWVGARERSDFAAFEPHLREAVELAHRYVECFDGFETPYDVLLDDFAPGMRTGEVQELFAQLRAELVPMIAAIAASPGVDESPLFARFPESAQRALADEVLAKMGFTESAWRLDDAVHPFAVSVGRGDVRITARFEADNWPTSLYSVMHECGHGLYEAGIADIYRRTPLGSIDSLAQHESQSRLWENMVGRGRAFCEVLAPRIADLAGGELAGLSPDGLYRAVNRVTPSHIRVDADEATYALHIILRFELEQRLIDGTLDAADVPEAWNARFAELLGIEVGSDADGVLQDVHWAAGLIGYFPTYALGNLIAGQLWERAHAELPGLEEALAAGELAGLREWLRERVHRFGAKYPTTELLEREAGGPMSVAPFVRYLKEKLGDVYGIDLDGLSTASDTRK